MAISLKKWTAGLTLVLLATRAANAASEVTCSDIFGPTEIPLALRQVKPVPGLFSSLISIGGSEQGGKWGIHSRAEIIRENAAIEKAKADRTQAIADATTALTQLRASIKSGVTHSVEAMRALQLLQTFENEINQATSKEDAEARLASLKDGFNKIKIKSSALDQSVAEELSSAKKFIVASPRGVRADLRTQYDAAFPIITTAEEIDQIRAANRSLMDEMQRTVTAFNDAEAARRKLEMRFDPLKPEASQEILNSFRTLAEPLLTGAGAEGFGQVNWADAERAIATDADLRKFVYRELQFLRWMKNKTKSYQDKATRLRASIDASILIDHIADPKAGVPIPMVLALRTSLRLLSNPRNFSKVVPKGSMRKFNGMVRERILADALQLEPLALTILGSSAALPNVIAAPVRPNKPVRPSYADVPRSGSRSYRVSIRSRNRQLKDQYNRAKADYAAAIARFEAARALRAKQITTAKAVQARRLASREALINYLAHALPEIFTGVVNGNRVDGKVVAAAIVASQKQIAERRVQRLQPEQMAEIQNRVSAGPRIRSSSISRLTPIRSSGYYGGYDFMMAMYTGNPMWLINPDIAMMQLWVDIATNNSPMAIDGLGYSLQGYDAYGNQSAQDNSGNYQNLNSAQGAIDQWNQNNGTNAQDYQNYLDSQAQDAPLGIAGQPVDSALSSYGTTPDPAAVGDASTDPAGVTAGAFDPPDATIPNQGSDVGAEDWNAFKSGSDADWKDDKADPADPNDPSNGTEGGAHS